jgi:hypothetical protein
MRVGGGGRVLEYFAYRAGKLDVYSKKRDNHAYMKYN